MHKAQVLIINCMDFRLQKDLIKWLSSKNLEGKYDLVSVGGGGKALLEGEEEVKKFILNHIQLAIQLHHVQEVWVIHHQDCGAYGGSSNWSSLEEEINFQKEQLRKVKGKIAFQFPQLKAKSFLAYLKDNKWEFKEV